MGRRFTAKIHLRSPFDSGHSRLQGDYSNIEEPENVATFLKDYHKALEGSESEKFHQFEKSSNMAKNEEILF